MVNAHEKPAAIVRESRPCNLHCIRKRAMPENLTIITPPATIEHLGLLRKGDCATVTGLATVVGDDRVAMRMRLLELGFAPGEQIRVVAESFPRRDPIAVRIGNSTFALRRHEAAMVHIERAKST